MVLKYLVLLNGIGIIHIKHTTILSDLFIRHYKGGENVNKQTNIKQTNKDSSSYQLLQSDGRIA